MEEPLRERTLDRFYKMTLQALSKKLLSSSRSDDFFSVSTQPPSYCTLPWAVLLTQYYGQAVKEPRWFFQSIVVDHFVKCLFRWVCSKGYVRSMRSIVFRLILWHLMSTAKTDALENIDVDGWNQKYNVI